jgi:hypothetical protein
MNYLAFLNQQYCDFDCRTYHKQYQVHQEIRIFDPQ